MAETWPEPTDARPASTEATAQAQAILDLRVLIPEARAGNEAAVLALHALTEAILAVRLRRYPLEAADQARSAITEKMLGGANFDPHWPLPDDVAPEEVPHFVLSRYKKYLGKVARSVVSDMANPRESRLEQQDNLDTMAGSSVATACDVKKYHNGDATTAISDEVLERILTEPQRRIFRLRLTGISQVEIGEQLGINPKAVTTGIQRILKRLEEHILHPAGFHRFESLLSSVELKRDVVHDAIIKGMIPAVKILHGWYTKEAWLQELLPPKNTVRLRTVASEATVRTFERMHSERLRFHGGHTYISTTDLPLVEELNAQKQAAHETYVSPRPGYIALSDIPCVATEAALLRYGLVRGIYSDPFKHRGRNFVREAEALAELERIRAKE